MKIQSPLLHTRLSVFRVSYLKAQGLMCSLHSLPSLMMRQGGVFPGFGASPMGKMLPLALSSDSRTTSQVSLSSTSMTRMTSSALCSRAVTLLRLKIPLPSGPTWMV